MLMKLLTTTGIQELKVKTDTRNKAFVKRWFCNALLVIVRNSFLLKLSPDTDVEAADILN